MARQRKFEDPDEIARAALHLIDAEGLERLTMRRVGRALGVEAMTLYGYFKNRDELLDAVHALLLADVESPRPTDDWIDDARVLAQRFRARLMAHPNAVAIVATRPATKAASLDVLEACLSVVPPSLAHAAADIVQTMFVFVVGHCSFHAGTRREHAPPIIDMGRHPTLARTQPSTADDEFELGLEILVAGLRAIYGTVPSRA